MATVELPDDVAAALIAAQAKLKDSQRELEEANAARVAADDATRNADVQMVESNQAAVDAAKTADEAIQLVTKYLKK